MSERKAPRQEGGKEASGGRRLLKKSDLLIIGIILVICAGALLWMSFGGETGDVNAIISYQGETVKTIPLNTASDGIFRLEENPKVGFQIKDHRIRFIETECPDHLCENVGYIDRSGQTAICLPNRVTLEIVGGEEAEEDYDILVN